MNKLLRWSSEAIRRQCARLGRSSNRAFWGRHNSHPRDTASTSPTWATSHDRAQHPVWPAHMAEASPMNWNLISPASAHQTKPSSSSSPSSSPSSSWRSRWTRSVPSFMSSHAQHHHQHAQPMLIHRSVSTSGGPGDEGKPSWWSREATVAPATFNRWLMVAPAFFTHVCLGSVYGWSLFNQPLTQELGVLAGAADDWSMAQTMPAFSVLLAGKWLERVGPRTAGVLGSLLFGGGTIVGGAGIMMHSLPLLYAGYGFLAGVGIGLAYVPPVATLVRWFPDKKGLASGIVVMGFGGGALAFTPFLNTVMKAFYRVPEYVGDLASVDLISEAGKRFAQVGGEAREVVVAGAAEVAKALLPGLEPGVYLVGTGCTGAGQAMLAMGVVQSALLLGSALSFRTPPPDYDPVALARAKREARALAQQRKPAANAAMAAAAPAAAAPTVVPHTFNVHVDDAFRTPQFWLLFTTFSCLGTAGMSILSVAKDMMSDVFSNALPGVVTASFAASFVGALSAGNLGGRLLWGSVSDRIGRKATFAILACGSVPLYISIPYLAQWVSEEPSVVPLVAFYGATMALVSFFGSAYSVTPSYEADLFGTKFLGANHGRMLLASTLASTVGPITVAWQRKQATVDAIKALVNKVNPDTFEATFGAPLSELQQLVETNAVTIAKLMEIVPAGTLDPTPFLYNQTMYGAAGLACVAACSNLLIRPVRKSLHMTPGDERPATVIAREHKAAEEEAVTVVDGHKVVAEGEEGSEKVK